MSKKSSKRFLLVLLATALSACDQQPLEVVQAAESPLTAPLASVAPTQDALLARIRAATARYHRVEAAEADGYQLIVLPSPPFPPGATCLPGEGVRYVRFDLYNGVVDPTEPEQLLYERLPNGVLRLAAVGFIVPAAAWNPANGLPHLGNQPFMDRTSPPFGAPFPNYALFAWLWMHNPDGMYTLRNPRLTC
ncbi:hypothetical protein BH23GEM9_BH23GEM9_29360 [soil metagenome]